MGYTKQGVKIAEFYHILPLLFNLLINQTIVHPYKRQNLRFIQLYKGGKKWGLILAVVHN